MSNWRIVRQWHIEEWRYTIEDVLPENRMRIDPNLHPFVQHVGSGHFSPEELKAELLAKLKAFDLPILEMTQPVLRPVLREAKRR